MKKSNYAGIDENVDCGIEEIPQEIVDAITVHPMDEFILDMDVKTTTESLPEPEQTVCRMLLEGYSQREICRNLKISRNDLKNKHLPFIRQRFLDYGFEAHEINF